MRPKFYHRISVRVAGMNLIMLLAFMVTLSVTLLSVRTMVDTMESISSMQNAMLKQEAAVKDDVNTVESSIRSLMIMYAFQYGQEGAGKEAQRVHDAHADLTENLSKLREEFSLANSQEAMTFVDELDALAADFIEGTSNVADNFAKGNSEGAFAVVGGDYSEKAAAMRDKVSELETLINDSVTGMSSYIEVLLNSVVRASIIGGVVVVLLIVVNFLVTFLGVSRLITRISGEITQIITGIREGHGDLTARIQTKVKNELIYFVNSFNDFIDTVQGIIGEVKGGTVVLAKSSEDMTLRVRNANENVMNTSAAMEELAASMDAVAENAGDMNHRVAEVRAVT